MTTCYLDSATASDYLSSAVGRELYESKMKRIVGNKEVQILLYLDYGASKLSGTFHSIDSVNISKKMMIYRGKKISVYEFLELKYPHVLKFVPKEDYCVNLQFGRKIYPCAGKLIRRSFSTQELKEIDPRLSDLSRISPEDRISLIENYLEKVNPINVNEKIMVFNSEFANEKYFKIFWIRYPNLKFKNDTIISCKGEMPNNPKFHYVPFNKWSKAKNIGLLEYGPYEAGELERVYFLVPEDDKVDKEVANQFVNYLTSKFQKFQKFEVKEVLNYSQADTILAALSSKHENFFAIAILPPDNETFYPHFKGGVENPIQCVKYETIHVNPNDYSSEAEFEKALRKRENKIFALMSKIIAKTSGKPWILGENLYYDLTIGIDVGRAPNGKTSDCASVFYFCGKNAEHYGILPRIPLKRESLSIADTYKILMKIVTDVHDLIKINAIAIHRDGFLSREEKSGFKQAYDELVSKGILTSFTELVGVNISETNHPYRLFMSKNEQIFNPKAGKYLSLNGSSCVLVTTGYPFIKGERTADPILLKAEAIAGYYDIHKVVRDVFSFTELNWNSPLNTVKLPVTVRHADAMATQYIKYKIKEYFPG